LIIPSSFTSFSLVLFFKHKTRSKIIYTKTTTSLIITTSFALVHYGFSPFFMLWFTLFCIWWIWSKNNAFMEPFTRFHNLVTSNIKTETLPFNRHNHCSIFHRCYSCRWWHDITIGSKKLNIWKLSYWCKWVLFHLGNSIFITKTL
jgi:hypothetical protein